MSTTTVTTPTSRLRFGLARVDITPPVGMYHPMWGAARHQRATGIHRLLTAEALAFAPLADGEPIIRFAIDHVGMDDDQQATLVAKVSAACQLPAANVLTTFSHTHASGNFARDRIPFPGGELIEPYLAELYAHLVQAAQQAVANLQEAVITYSTGKCNLAANRDYWDDANGLFACGFNADAPWSDDTVLLARVTDRQGALLATVVNYACHPTTLAWENTLISPDYIGAMREVIEKVTGAPAVFAQGACGELGPRWGQQGDTAVADANGRQLGYAALATLDQQGPPLADYHYQGPVVSGATLGDWRYQPFTPERLDSTALFQGGSYTVELPQKPLPDPVALEAEMEDWGTKQQEADAQGDKIAARNYGARAERARRWRMRVHYLIDRPTYTYHFSVHRLGDAIWITTGGEPYNVLQTELRRRFPGHPLLITPLAGDFQVAYLLPSDRYGRGLYQEEPSILAAGCLEILIEAIAERIQALI